MMLVPPGISVHLVPGFTDLRRNIDALGISVQQGSGVIRSQAPCSPSAASVPI
jgi:hypothetical protein